MMCQTETERCARAKKKTFKETLQMINYGIRMTRLT